MGTVPSILRIADIRNIKNHEYCCLEVLTKVKPRLLVSKSMRNNIPIILAVLKPFETLKGDLPWYFS